MTVWTHCYQDGWQGLIVADETPDASQGTLLTRGEVGNAFQHPAKVSRNLIQRLYAHLASHYGLRPGRGVLDPFAGTGLHALDALLAGYHFVGVEIEERFVRLAQANLTYWGHKFGPQPGTATVLHGDSRELGRLLGTAGCLVSSPPYNLPMSQDHNGSKGGARGTTPSEHGAFVKYGSTPGQLEGLPMGSLAAVLSSPPYADGCAHTGGADRHPAHIHGGKHGVGLGYVVASPPYAGNEKHDYLVTNANGRDRDTRRGKRQGHGSFRGSETYGRTAGQLGALPSGSLAVVLSSPPYVDRCANDNQRTMAREGLHIGHNEGDGQTYGTTAGQLGTASPDTFWTAAHTIMQQCWEVLAPGAVAVWICKDFVRNQRRVGFSHDWCRLCVSVGFVLLEWIEASLVDIYPGQEDLFGMSKPLKVSHKSFFRTLAERAYDEDDERRINHEDVLIFRR